MTSLDSMKEHRIETLTLCFEELFALVNQYWTDGTEASIKCPNKSSRCDALRLGSLLKGLKRCGLYPRLQSPFCGITLFELAASLNGIEIPACTEAPPYTTEKCQTCQSWNRASCSWHQSVQCEFHALKEMSETLTKNAVG